MIADKQRKVLAIISLRLSKAFDRKRETSEISTVRGRDLTVRTLLMLSARPLLTPMSTFIPLPTELEPE